MRSREPVFLEIKAGWWMVVGQVAASKTKRRKTSTSHSQVATVGKKTMSALLLKACSTINRLKRNKLWNVLI